MHKITNISSLGTAYTVANQEGVILSTIQIISHKEILDAAIGSYEDFTGSYAQYLDRSTSLLTGNEDSDLYSVLWYASDKEDVVLADVVAYAIKYGYTTVIVEQLDKTLH